MCENDLKARRVQLLERLTILPEIKKDGDCSPPLEAGNSRFADSSLGSGASNRGCFRLVLFIQPGTDHRGNRNFNQFDQTCDHQ